MPGSGLDADLLTAIGLTLIAIPVVTCLYAYVVYPLALWLVALPKPRRSDRTPSTAWPVITITLPVYNEERTLRSTLEHVLALDYPPDRRHVLVISDASSDGTDAIARAFASRGVQLIRLPRRAGKTAAENAAAAHVQGDIIVNIDATARPARNALKALVAEFDDPTVGVASGRDVSTGAAGEHANSGESGYVGYEMWIRSLETRLGSIVGASGCFYGIRRTLYEPRFPDSLSRDFASALIAWEHGFRAVSVDAALCGVPRAPSLDLEYRRKVRTMHRGLETLWYKRRLLDPLRYGRFAVMLFSHKLCRWLVPLTLPIGAVGLIATALGRPLAAWLLAITLAGMALSTIARRRADSSGLARKLALPTYLFMGSIAGLLAWWEAIRRQREAIWEPTRRAA